MRYNLKIGKSRYANKTLASCIDIIAARYTEINAKCITPAAWILFEIINMPDNALRLAYHDKNEKVFISINRGKTK
jgi:hypothetical protein